MFERLAIPDVFLYTPKRFVDERGYFTETFNAAVLAPMVGPLDWVQDNQSQSIAVGSVRGLHFQAPPFAQDKLVRCLRGVVLDVAVDIRHGSPTFGRHVSAVLSAETGTQMFIPKGFAHGFITREPDTVIAYKVSNYYNPAYDRGVRFDDPALAIVWDAPETGVRLSDRDARLPALAETPPCFRYP